MEWVIGIGGVFFRAKDPKVLALWYHDHLGIDSWYRDEQGIDTAVDGEKVWQHQRGSPEQAWMVNFRVDDLDAMLAQLRAAGAVVEDNVQEAEDVGRIGRAYDPKGNCFELWEPSSLRR